MSGKRARGDPNNLSGGTGDVNPQTFVVTVTQTGVDTPTQLQFPVPVARYPGSRDRAVVMEILDVTFILGDLVPVATNAAIVGILSTRAISVAAGQFAARTDSSNIAQFRKDLVFFSASGAVYSDGDTRIDLTDAAGHGVLVAVDQLVVSLITAATGTVNQLGVKMRYRLKEIGLSEYIGIVQSQQ